MHELKLLKGMVWVVQYEPTIFAQNGHENKVFYKIK